VHLRAIEHREEANTVFGKRLHVTARALLIDPTADVVNPTDSTRQLVRIISMHRLI
jgi:hypothetical protein